jgi:NTE family protein
LHPVPLRIGLALGGGAVRGFAHIGVIKARGLRPDLLCGTSAGSVVAALYGLGISGIAINELALTFD